MRRMTLKRYDKILTLLKYFLKLNGSVINAEIITWISLEVRLRCKRFSDYTPASVLPPSMIAPVKI